MTKIIILILSFFILCSTCPQIKQSADPSKTINPSDICIDPIKKPCLSASMFIPILLRIAHLPSLSIGIIKNNSISTFFYGETSRGQDNTPTKNTIYYAGSISKRVTATAILQLYEQGKIWFF